MDQYGNKLIIDNCSNLIEVLGLGCKHRGDVEFGHGLRRVISTGRGSAAVLQKTEETDWKIEVTEIRKILRFKL